MIKKKNLLLFLTGISICAFALCGCSSKTEQEETTFAIEGKYVNVAQYKDVEVQEVTPTKVDEEYLDSKLNNVVSIYNSYMGTEYSDLSDETVQAVTGGVYQTRDEWANALKDEYQDGEDESAVWDMGNAVLQQVIANSEIKGYNEIDYDEEYQSCIEGFLGSSGVETVEEYCEENDMTEEEFYTMVDETAVYNLGYDYIVEAIAEEEGLMPTNEEMEELKNEHMEQILLMGYTEDDEYYQEELEHWESEEDSYRMNLIYEKLIPFLYENANVIK